MNLSNTEINNIITESLSILGDNINNLDLINTSQTTSEENAVTLNSNTVLVDDTTSRFSSATWYKNIQSKNVVLAGIGGIGSYCAFLLSRLRINELILYDPDIVEATNMAGQLYRSSFIGTNKVDAMYTIVSEFSSYNSVVCINEMYTEESITSKIMICGFDNMEARKVFFNKWKNYVLSLPEEERKECLFIDGRLNAEEYQVLCIKGDDSYNIKRYEEEFLFSDTDVEEAICSYKQTTFMANMIGSVMINLFVNFTANELNPLMERDLPFYTYYSAETMYFKTER
jgi:hypothetical protein